MPFLERAPVSQLASLKQQQEQLVESSQNAKREAQRVLELVRAESGKRSSLPGPAEGSAGTEHQDATTTAHSGESPASSAFSAPAHFLSPNSMELASPAVPPPRSASRGGGTPRREGDARVLGGETELLHQVARLTLSHHEEMQASKEREQELELHVSELRQREETRQREQASELALQQQIVDSLKGQVDYLSKMESKISECESATDGCESKLRSLAEQQQRVASATQAQRSRREERIVRRLATLEVATAFDAFIVQCQASREERKLCRRVVDSVMLKNSKDLIMAEQALEECQAALAAAEFNFANSQRHTSESQEELAETQERLKALETLAAKSSELEDSINESSKEAACLRQALQVAKQERHDVQVHFDEFRTAATANLRACKDQLEQREREVNVTKSELEESGSIIVDRLVLTTELQKTNDRLSAELRQAVSEKEEAISESRRLQASAEESLKRLGVMSERITELEAGQNSALQECQYHLAEIKRLGAVNMQAEHQRQEFKASKIDLQIKLDAALKELEAAKVVNRDDREAETLKLAEFEEMGKSLSEELARCEAEKAGLDTALAMIQQDLEDTKAQLQAEASAREREKEAQREADIQQSFREEKACVQVLALQGEVDSLLDTSRRADHERSELEKAHKLSNFNLASMSSELSSVSSQLDVQREELKMEQSRARARERELEWEREKECGKLERTLEEEQERVSILNDKVQHLKRQLARESEALGKERNAAALEREKSEMERVKLKEVPLPLLCFPVLLLQVGCENVSFILQPPLKLPGNQGRGSKAGA